jgi:hypothetical protein
VKNTKLSISIVSRYVENRCIGDTSLTHVMRLAAHSTTSSTSTAMEQSFIMTFIMTMYKLSIENGKNNVSIEDNC